MESYIRGCGNGQYQESLESNVQGDSGVDTDWTDAERPRTQSEL